MKKQALRRDLQELLDRHSLDKYTGLHNYMMSEHIVRWIEEYIREQNVAKNWSTEPQTSYYDYMKEAKNGVKFNSGPPVPDPEREQRDPSVAQSHGEDPSKV